MNVSRNQRCRPVAERTARRSSLKPIGWWIESLADEERPAPQELVGQLPAQVRRALANYLARGLRLNQYRGYSWCRFDCGVEYSKMGHCDLTDGTWVWPEGLAHYVEVHGVTLPDEFIGHALSGACPTLPDGPPHGLSDYDTDYWVRWCSTRRSPQIRKRLRSALIAAEARVFAIKLGCAGALERKHGLSNERCIWAHCTRKALSNRLICAKHFLDSDDPAVGQMPLFSGLHECLRQLPG